MKHNKQELNYIKQPKENKLKNLNRTKLNVLTWQLTEGLLGMHLLCTLLYTEFRKIIEDTQTHCGQLTDSLIQNTIISYEPVCD